MNAQDLHLILNVQVDQDVFVVELPAKIHVSHPNAFLQIVTAKIVKPN